MKFIAYIFIAAFFFTVLLNPFIELFGEFNDRCRIGAAVKISCRSAILAAADEQYLKDVREAVKAEDFAGKFKENFCCCLNLEQKSPADPYTYISADKKYNDFIIDVNWLNEKECEIEVKTAYRFKTNLFRRLLGEWAEKGPAYIVLRYKQVLNVKN